MTQKNSSTQIDGKLYNVTIQAQIVQAITSVKFPSLFYLQWKTNDQKHIVQTGKYSPNGQKVTFNETITLSATVIYERTKKVFLKKETQVQLNLLSKNRPDQPKLVGRVTIDLATLLNDKLYSKPTMLPLQFCSVNASILISFEVTEKVETDTSFYELERSMEGVSFNSALKGLNPQTSIPNLEKSRDESLIPREITPINSSRILEKNMKKEDMSIGNSSPKVSESGVIREHQFKQSKETTNSAIQETKVVQDEKSKTKSFKAPKLTQLIQNCHRKIGTVLSEESRLNDETLKLRGEVDLIKLESSKQRQQDERIRLELQKKLRDSQFVKLQLRQKQTLVDQSAAEISLLRNESQRLREEATKLREEAVSSTIKMAELKDNYNRTTSQLSTSEREIKRLETSNDQLNVSQKQISFQVIQVQNQFHESSEKFSILQKEKSQLQHYIKEKEAQYRRNVQSWQNQSQTNYHQKQSLLLEISTLKSQLKNQTDTKLQFQSRLKKSEEEVNRLTAVERVFQDARHSWDISQGVHSEQTSRKGQRMHQLEETLINLSERVKWLQGQNELLTQNYRHSRQQCLRVETQKTQSLKQANSKFQICSNNLQQERNHLLALLNQKNSLENNLNTLIVNFQTLSRNYQLLTSEYSTLNEKQNKLIKKLEEEKEKCVELEEGILSGNQQRQRESREAADRQKNYEMRVMELQNVLQTANQHMTILEQRGTMLEEELKGRQDLIMKLQQGLSVQIQRTDALNLKLLAYIEKDERMKDLAVLMEEEHRKMDSLIAEQQNNQVKAELILKERQSAISELVMQLEESSRYSRHLELVLEHKQNQNAKKLISINIQVSEQIKKYQELQENNQQNLFIIQELKRKLAQAKQNHQSDILNNQQLISDKNLTIQVLKNEKNQLQLTGKSFESKIASLNKEVTKKQKLILDHVQRQNTIEQHALEKDMNINELNTLISDLQNKMKSLESSKSQLQNQVALKEEIIKQQNSRYTQLEALYNTIANDRFSFDLVKYHQQIKEKTDTVRKLQTQIVNFEAEVAKVNSLERSLKIKTIELNSMKFKGKGQIPESNQLLRLKDEEITALLAQKQQLIKIQQQFVHLQQQIGELQGQLQVIEEERFNVESVSNERALGLEQAKQQNRKLMEEITIIGEKHGQLQKILYELTSSEGGDKNIKSDAVLKAENISLRGQLKDYQALKSRVYELQAKEEHHMVNFLDENNQISSKKDSKASVQQSKIPVHLTQTYQSLKRLLEERVKGKLLQKIYQTIDKLLGKEENKVVEEKIRVLSKDFAKLKVQLLKAGQVRNNQQKTQMLGHIQGCEATIGEIVSLFE